MDKKMKMQKGGGFALALNTIQRRRQICIEYLDRQPGSCMPAGENVDDSNDVVEVGSSNDDSSSSDEDDHDEEEDNDDSNHSFLDGPELDEPETF